MQNLKPHINAYILVPGIDIWTLVSKGNVNEVDKILKSIPEKEELRSCFKNFTKV